LCHPENPDLNSDKDVGYHDFSSARLNIWLTKKDESVLISVLLKTKLIFFSFNLDNSLWNFEASKDIPVSIERGLYGEY
jgi:hypothetical protein